MSESTMVSVMNGSSQTMIIVCEGQELLMLEPGELAMGVRVAANILESQTKEVDDE